MRFLPLRPYLAVSRMFGRRAADGLVWPFVHTFLNAELDRSLAAITSGGTEGSSSPATAFEAALRPLLVPRERADDLDAWAQSNFCRAWVRKGWLASSFASTDRFEEASRLLAARCTTSTTMTSTSTSACVRRRPVVEGDLPTHAEVVRMFALEQWNRELADPDDEDDEDDEGGEDNEDCSGEDRVDNSGDGDGEWDWSKRPAEEGGVRGGEEEGEVSEAGGGFLESMPPASTRDLSFPDLLERAGCAVAGRSEFNAYCEINHVYEFLTREYVERLADYLTQRCRHLSTMGGGNHSHAIRGESGHVEEGREAVEDLTAAREGSEDTGDIEDREIRMDRENREDTSEQGTIISLLEVRVLEVGAGSGLLTRSLRARMPADAVRLIACDDFSWPIGGVDGGGGGGGGDGGDGGDGDGSSGGDGGAETEQGVGQGVEQEQGDESWGGRWIAPPDEGSGGAIEVEPLSCAAALLKYQPTVVVCSWMPQGVDWSAEIRATKSVQEYILVGEVDGGCCGDPWLTWGHSSFDATAFDLNDTAPYVVDGFERVDLDDTCGGGGCSRGSSGSGCSSGGGSSGDDDIEGGVEVSGSVHTQEGAAPSAAEAPASMSAWQWGRYDCAAFARNSRTIAFRRRPSPCRSEVRE